MAALVLLIGVTGTGSASAGRPLAIDAGGDRTVDEGDTVTVDATYTTATRVLYGATGPRGGTPSRLYTIDRGTGAATLVGSIGFRRVSGMDFDENGVLYATGFDPSTGRHSLLTIDTTTGAGALVGRTFLESKVGGFRNTGGLSFRNSDGLLYAFASRRGTLVTIDKATGVGTVVGTSGPRNAGNGIAFSPTDTLFHADHRTFNTLDQNTGGLITSTGWSFPCCDRFNALDFDLDTGELFGSLFITIGSLDYELATINVSTGGVTKIGRTIFGLDAIAFSPEIIVGEPESFTAEIDWGDFTVEPGTVVETSPGGGGAPATGIVSGSHVYNDNGVFDVRVTVTGDLGARGIGRFTATVENVAPTVDAGPPRTIAEGDNITLAPTFSDPGFDGTALPITVLYGATSRDSGGDDLYRIDRNTGGSNLVGPIGFNRVSGMDFDDNGVLFASGFDPSNRHVLITIDTNTGAGTLVGFTDVETLGINFRNIAGMSTRNSDDALFGMHARFPFLLKFDKATGEASVVGSSGGCCPRGNGIAFSPDDTLFWARDNSLFTLDPDTGAVVDFIGALFSLVNAMDFDPDSGKLFGILRDGQRSLATIDTETGQVTQIGPTVSRMDALAFGPHRPTEEDFTASIDWGDGTVEPLTVVETPGSPGVPTTGTMSLGSHTYADNDDYTVRVTVEDDDGGVGVGTVTVTVTNVNPSVEAGLDQLINPLIGGRTLDLDPSSFSDPGFDFDLSVPGVLYGATNDFTNSILHVIDRNTGEATPVGPIGFRRVSGMDFDENGVLFATGFDPSNRHALITINTSTGAGTLVGFTDVETLGINFRNIAGMSTRNSDDALFGMHARFPFLLKFDKATGEASVVGFSGGCCPRGNGIAFSPDDTLFWARDNSLFTLDPDTGAGTFVASLIISRINAMDFDPETGVLHGILNIGPDVLVTINTDTGLMNLIGLPEAGNRLDALAFSPAIEFHTEENFTAEIDWGDTSTDPGTVVETPGSAGVPTAGTVSGGHTYAANGVFTIRVTVTDDDGGVGTDTFEVIINTPPDCSGAAPSIAELWPPDHEFVAITVLGVTDPDGDPFTITIDSIFQDEPVDTFGDGTFTPDGLGVGTATAQVRAERAGSIQERGDGRVYHIGFTADDGLGSCSGEVLVGVPFHIGRFGQAHDGGALYDSTLP